MYVTSAYCISQLSHHCDRTPDENSLREEELIVAHSLTVHSPSWHESHGWW